MLIERATFRNVGPHRFLDIKFQPGLVGIFGSNGSGKSTITNGIYACMTNDFSRFPETRDKLINDQCDPGDLSEIAVDLNIHNVVYAMKRELGRSKCRMQFQRPGQIERRLDKDGEFQAELFGALGFPRNVLDNFVFINQWETFAFLKSTPTERMKAFHGICNTGKSEKIWDASGQRIAADATMVAEVTDNLADFRTAKEDAAAEYLKKNEAATALVPERVNETRLKELANRIDAMMKLCHLQQDLVGAESALKKATEESDSASAKLKPLEAERVRLAGIVESIDTRDAKKCIPILQEYLTQQKMVEEDRQKIADLTSKIEELDLAIDQLELPEALVGVSADDVQEQLTLARADVAVAERFVKKFGGSASGICPTCGQPAAELIAKYRKVLDELPPKIQQDAEILTVLSDFAHEVQVTTQVRDQAQARRQALESQLESRTYIVLDDSVLPDLSESPEDDLDHYQDQLSQKQLAEDALAAFDKTILNPAKLKVASAAGALPLATKRVKDLKTQIDEHAEKDAGELEGVRAEYSAGLAANNRYTTAYELAKAAKVTAENAAAAYKRAKQALEDARQRSQTARSWLERLGKIREVFHRDAAPKLVAQSRLESLEDDINLFLEPFGSPFTVRAGDDFTLLAQVPGHAERSAVWLSGGQKVVLSMAFLLSQSPGLLVLDEPGAGLDDANSAYLRTALQHFQQVAKSRGLQIIMITHDKSMESSFNQVIRL